MERTCENCKHFEKGANEYPCQVCVHNAVDKFEAGTNADHIRSMTDEELAEELANFAYDNEPTVQWTLEWLQQPRKE